MKKFSPLVVFLICSYVAFAQTPEKMSYQAIVRDANNILLVDKLVGIQVSILQNSETGSEVYIETHSVVTNMNGLVVLEIGMGVTSYDFSSLDWTNGPYFVKIETDPNGAANYTISGVSQLMSVPFALYAKTSENGITSDQADAIEANTLKVGYTDALVSDNTAVVANTAKVGITSQQATDITSNTAKTGITSDQADAIVANTAKISLPSGGNEGDILKIVSGEYVWVGETTYQINTFYSELGGYVIDINSNGTHGVVVAMQDQGFGNWYDSTNKINDPANHDSDGAKFRDWRLPSKRELNLIYLVYLNSNPISLLNTTTYWSSFEFNSLKAWCHAISTNAQYYSSKYGSTFEIRAVRSF